MNLWRLLNAGCLLVIVSAGACLAQNGEEITVPSTPAFSILNFEPAAIMRPSNPKELSADILNSFDENGQLLMNVGIEVAPYWLKSRPQLTRDQYLNAKGKQAFFQTLMISAATVKDTITNKNKIGAGFRFRLSNGEVTGEYRAKEKSLVARATMIAAVNSARVFIQMPDENQRLKTKQEVIVFIENVLQNPKTGFGSEELEEFRTYARGESSNYADDPADLLLFTSAISSRIDEASDELKKEVVALSLKRIGFTTELAGAASFFSQSGGSFERAGIWFNAANVRSQTDSWNFSARYFFTNSDSSSTNFDFGGAYIKELTKFSVSIEAMGRFFRAEKSSFDIDSQPVTVVNKDFTWRLAAQASYKIAEDISINVSLGKDFDSPFANTSSFFSIFGIRYSIFKNNKAVMPLGAL